MKNKHWSTLPKDHSFTAYCAANTHFCLVCARIRSFVRVPFPLSIHTSIYVTLAHVLLCACPYPLLDRGLSLSPNRFLLVWPRIITVFPPLLVVGLIRLEGIRFSCIRRNWNIECSLNSVLSVFHGYWNYSCISGHVIYFPRWLDRSFFHISIVPSI